MPKAACLVNACVNSETQSETQSSEVIQQGLLVADNALLASCQDVWGMPDEEDHCKGAQPIRDTVKTMAGRAQHAAYQAFLTDRQRRSTHYPRGQSCNAHIALRCMPALSSHM